MLPFSPPKKTLPIQIVYKHVQKLIFMLSDKDSEIFLDIPFLTKNKNGNLTCTTQYKKHT